MQFSDDALNLGATSLSYSKLKLGLKCPFSFQKRYREFEKPTNKIENSKALIGTTVHTILEETLKQFANEDKISLTKIEDSARKTMGLVFNKGKLTNQEMEEVYFLQASVKAMVVRFLQFQKRNNSKLYLEEELAIDSNFNPVSYTSRDAFFRGKLDLLVVNPSGVIAVIDHKTGYKSLKGYEDQLRSYEVLVTFALAPKILEEHNIQAKTIRTGLNFVNEEEIVWSLERPIDYIHTKTKEKFIKWVNTACGDALSGKIRRGRHCNHCGYRSFCGSKVGTRKKKINNQINI